MSKKATEFPMDISEQNQLLSNASNARPTSMVTGERDLLRCQFGCAEGGRTLEHIGKAHSVLNRLGDHFANFVVRFSKREPYLNDKSIC